MEKALVLTEGRYLTTDGKTAHGLVRYSKKYKIVGLVDSTLAGRDAGEVLDGIHRGIPIYGTIEEALRENPDSKWLIIGVATPGGVLPSSYKRIVAKAIKAGLGVVNGLHHFLSDDPYLKRLAKQKGVEIIDVRKIFYNYRVPFTGKIEDVKATKVAVLGTDAAIGKRTTAIMLHEAFKALGLKSEFIAMGQTGWMQGFKYCIVMDSIVNDFVAGAIEDVFYRAWAEERPDVIVTHGEGSLLHPAFPGGFELIGAARPDFIVLQHAPGRLTFDDFPQYRIPPLENYIRMIELLSGKPPIAITINTQNLTKEEALEWAERIESETGIMTRVPFYQGVEDIARLIASKAKEPAGVRASESAGAEVL
ncbi:DUF1611 domain-containing protein [Thermococcus waiotapuensis]|uniref:DUF1611 domain-containing protein n=1 Tax=Thermococcus waiotapuensis TaxID=90909 RepID=A0AAE4NUN4_9EURY|nr:DUF1611 domain-containing protein [Thermococcus waiotapuensis]MDV3103444.1 DUF1611 domain-containing protein [Thermococcus waiotapuensis]